MEAAAGAPAFAAASRNSMRPMVEAPRLRFTSSAAWSSQGMIMSGRAAAMALASESMAMIG